MPQRRALITGIAGQDGSYLAELLLDRGYEVHGAVRGLAPDDLEKRLWRLRAIQSRINLHFGALEDYASFHKVVHDVQPQECYHLAAQSFVGYSSYEDEASTLQNNINATHRVLAALRNMVPECRCYFAASSEMFGNTEQVPQNELTRFQPRSIYGISKVAGFELIRNYRERFHMHASSGILFNHESPRRSPAFVTRRITSGVARILAGDASRLSLGNLEARRDWGHARDYVYSMWLMLQQPEPDDYVIATGESHTVRDFADAAFSQVGLDYRQYVTIDPGLQRPLDRTILTGDPAKARDILGWKHVSSFEDVVREMVLHDCQAAGRGAEACNGASGLL